MSLARAMNVRQVCVLQVIALQLLGRAVRQRCLLSSLRPTAFPCTQEVER